MVIEGFGNLVSQRMLAQREQRLFGLVIGFGVEDGVDLGLKLLFGLLTSLGGRIALQSLGCLAGRLADVAAQRAP